MTYEGSGCRRGRAGARYHPQAEGKPAAPRAVCRAGQRRYRQRRRVRAHRRHRRGGRGVLCCAGGHRLCGRRAGRPAGAGHGGRAGGKGHSRLWPQQGRRHSGRQQGVQQKPDEEVRHPHGRLRDVCGRGRGRGLCARQPEVPACRQGGRPCAGQGRADLRGRGRGAGRCEKHHGGQAVRRVGQPYRHRGVSHGAGGFCTQLY